MSAHDFDKSRRRQPLIVQAVVGPIGHAARLKSEMDKQRQWKATRRWAKRVCRLAIEARQQFLGPFDLTQLFGLGNLRESRMVVGMVAQLMAFGGKTLNNFRIFFDLFTKQEERGFGPVACQQVEQAGGVLRVRPVVESQVKGIAGGGSGRHNP